MKHQEMFKVFCLFLVACNVVNGGLFHRLPGYKYIYKSWPEVVGLDFQDAKSIIQNDLPFVKVESLPESEGVFHEFSQHKINLFVDESDKVVHIPDYIRQIPDWRQWPELLGQPADDAVAYIREDMPGMKIEVLGERDPMTLDLRPNRVRIIVNDDRIVTQVPHNG